MQYQQTMGYDAHFSKDKSLPQMFVTGTAPGLKLKPQDPSLTVASAPSVFPNIIIQDYNSQHSTIFFYSQALLIRQRKCQVQQISSLYIMDPDGRGLAGMSTAPL